LRTQLKMFYFLNLRQCEVTLLRTQLIYVKLLRDFNIREFIKRQVKFTLLLTQLIFVPRLHLSHAKKPPSARETHIRQVLKCFGIISSEFGSGGRANPTVLRLHRSNASKLKNARETRFRHDSAFRRQIFGQSTAPKNSPSKTEQKGLWFVEIG
jgi:hypothetical protein